MKTALKYELAKQMREALETYLTSALFDVSVPEEEIGLVQSGRLQEDLTINGYNLMVEPGGENFPDELYVEQNGLYGPVYEIGGPPVAWWVRRFKIEYKLYFAVSDKEVAYERAMVTTAMVKAVLQNLPILDLTDDFGERAHQIQVRKEYEVQGGGEGEWLWTGFVFVEFQTSRTSPYVP